MNFPYLLYRMAVDGDVDPVLELLHAQGLTVTWLLRDIGARPAALRPVEALSVERNVRDQNRRLR